MQNRNKSKLCKNKFVSTVLIFFFVFGLFTFNTFEPASAYNGTITYDSGTNTITCVGGSSGTPITFEDIYQFDLSNSTFEVITKTFSYNGWGNLRNCQYNFSCNLNIGDGSTPSFFSSRNEQIVISKNPSIINVKSNAFLNIGVLEDKDKHSTSQGSSFVCLGASFQFRGKGQIQVYSSIFQLFGQTNVGLFYDCSNVTIYNSIVEGYSVLARQISSIDMFGCHFSRGYGGIIWAVTGNVSNCEVYNSANGVIFQNGGTVRNIVARDLSSYFIRCEGGGDTESFLIDCSFLDADEWTIVYNNYSKNIYRQYTFNLNVLNGNITDFVEGATVQLWKDSTLVYEGVTNSSGMIPTQTLTYGYYQEATGNAIQNATSPYYLVVSHPEWQTYISRFYITEPLRLTVSMQEPTVTDYTEAEKSDYTTIILFIISLILCIIGLALTVPLLPLISLTISVLNIIFLSEPTIFNILLIILNVTFTVIALVRAKTKNN